MTRNTLQDKTRVYRFVCAATRERQGAFPSYREILVCCGLKSTAQVFPILDDLHRDGLLELDRADSGRRQYRIANQRVVLPKIAENAANLWDSPFAEFVDGDEIRDILPL